jgi:RNase P/RNase MRP subunit p30
MRAFIDLLVSAEVLTRESLRLLRELGFSGVGASVSVKRLISDPAASLEALRNLKAEGEAEGIDVISRITVDEPMGEGSLKKILRKFRRRVEVVSVHALDRKLTAFACRDARVDVITLLPGSRLLRGDLAYIREYGKAVEVLVAPLQAEDPLASAKALAYYSGVMELLGRKKMVHALILSSGATSPSALRDPRSMASLLSLMGLSYDAALDAVSANAARLVAECRDKLTGAVPVRGVRILRVGGDDR